MKTLAAKLLILVAAIGLSFLSNYFIKGWYNIIPWAIGALFIGYFSGSRRTVIINGAMFGYVLFLIYILLGYSGKTDTGSIIKFIAFNVLFSLVGAIAGVIGAFIGNWLKRKFAK
ncbi:DUF5518 domain-containing protein [Mucilaginibacter sp.]|uniref:DUF5518 domain-containing protein n=1 Tax=Mucilaginibacter sp. TaxID=1882438 RepID=UPI00284A6360|nr:DUF5518 domain-containing protein [Mucilaginibacter sp.]MDR3695834.1 DUF5518 domain-containing protein [Mucilaginibacter sp.]